ncbi:MAG: hypothetical protein ACKPKO_56220, partial [Candidatus Fonsibacter sp.]
MAPALVPSKKKARPARAGLGMGTEELQTPHFTRVFMALLELFRRAGATPLDLTISMGVNLDKGNKKEGPAADRAIHVYCPISKAYYGGLLRRRLAPELPSTHHGCAVGR